MGVIRGIVKGIDAVNRWMFALLSVFIVICTLIVFYDAITRYSVGKPSRFGFDLSVWLTAAGAFLGGGYMILKDEHIRIDFLWEKFSERGKLWVALLTHLFVLFVAFIFVWIGGEYVLTLMERGYKSTSGLNVPLWVKWSILPLGALLMGLQTLAVLVKDIYRLATGNHWGSIEENSETSGTGVGF